MKKFITTTILSTVILAPISANAGLFYAGLDTGIGVQYADERTFSASSYGAMVGIDLPIIRVEGEYNYLSGSRNSRDLTAHVAMANAYINLLPTPLITPYFGLGLGSLFAGEIGNSDLGSSLAYQAMFGIEFSIPVTPLYIDLEARALYANDVMPRGIDGDDFVHGDVRLKLRYSF